MQMLEIRAEEQNLPNYPPVVDELKNRKEFC